LRNALQQFAWQSTQAETWAMDYYQRQRAQGKSHRVAVRALANIWCGIIFALWTRREEYQRVTFEAAQQRHAPRAA
jgi:hypothetical protein